MWVGILTHDSLRGIIMGQWTKTQAIQGLLAATMLWLAGCSVDTGEFDSKTQELRCTGAAGDPDCPFKNWVRQTPYNGLNDIVHTGSPTLCVKPPPPGANPNSPLLTISRDDQNRYRTLHW